METFLIENSIHMLPPGLVSCLINGREYRITELSSDGLVIRSSEEIEDFDIIQVNFYSLYKSSYAEIAITDYIVSKHIKQEFCEVYRILTSQQDYKEQTYGFSSYYMKYIELKMTGDDGYCSEELTGYPAKEDENFCNTLTEQIQEWFCELGNSWDETVGLTDYELAVSIDNYQKYRLFLQNSFSTFYSSLLNNNYLSGHPLLKNRPDRIYIGNQFCHNLFPDDELLICLMDKALRENLKITVVFTYIRDNLLADIKTTVESIYSWCTENRTTVEIVVNDWGMTALLKGKEETLIPVLGVLLNKRRKDPRYKYKAGYELYIDKLAQNNLGLNEYRKCLKDTFHIERFEYESSGLKADMPVNHKSIHFPYYQTNTSQFCTLYAGYVNKDRSRQELVTDCPRYCEHMFYSYPKHLKMLGRYNSLFGMDNTILRDANALASILKDGTDRLVLDTK